MEHCVFNDVGRQRHKNCCIAKMMCTASRSFVPRSSLAALARTLLLILGLVLFVGAMESCLSQDCLLADADFCQLPDDGDDRGEEGWALIAAVALSAPHRPASLCRWRLDSPAGLATAFATPPGKPPPRH
jgi:hypothetical protein